MPGVSADSNRAENQLGRGASGFSAIAWRSPRIDLRLQLEDAVRAFRLAAPGYAFCFVVAALYHATCRKFAPGSEISLTRSAMVILIATLVLFLLSLVTVWALSIESNRITDADVRIPAAKRRIPWSAITGWRLVQEPGRPLRNLLLRAERQPVAAVTLPDDPAADSIIERFRARVPEDPSIALPVPVHEFLRPAASILIYAAVLISAVVLAYLDSRIQIGAFRSDYRSNMQLIAIGLMLVNGLVGPGLGVGLYLWRRGYGRQIVLAYALGTNFLAMTIAMMFTMPFFFADWRP